MQKKKLTITPPKAPQKFSLQFLAAKWPSGLVARKAVPKFTGGLYDAKTMANLDSLEEGPERIKIGRLVAYPVGPFIRWLEDRVDVRGHLAGREPLAATPEKRESEAKKTQERRKEQQEGFKRVRAADELDEADEPDAALSIDQRGRV